MQTFTFTRSLYVLALISSSLLTPGCGGSDGGPSAPTPPAAPNNVYRITISAEGAVSPTEVVVPPGTRVLFINNHAVRHQMSSDPHPDHTTCPELNQVGLLTQGQNRETGNLNTVRTCGFHDHENPGNASLRGRIVIR